MNQALPVLTVTLALLGALLTRMWLQRARYYRRERRAAAQRWEAVDGPWRVWLATVRQPALRRRRLDLLAARQVSA